MIAADLRYYYFRIYESEVAVDISLRMVAQLKGSSAGQR